MARSSSSENPMKPIGSVGEATPPEAMTLIWLAPALISSRTARLQASTPSTTRPNRPRRRQQPQGGSFSSQRPRKSAWPPVWLRACPDTNRRGPCTIPVSTATDSA
jgi:hypothetical protein